MTHSMSRTRTTHIESPSGTSLACEGRSSARVAKPKPIPPGTTAADHIMSLGYAFWKTKALLSAVELDLFTVLAEGPLGADELAARLQLHKRGARDFFDAL